MEEQEIILREINSYRKLMNIRSDKYRGSVTVEILKKHLLKKGYNISQRDVFIENIPNELDLLILKKGVNNKRLIYNPKDVLAIIEIKYNGSYSTSSLKQLKDKIRSLNKNIKTIYLTIFENLYYAKKATKENSSFEVFEFYYYKNYYKRDSNREDRRGWHKLLAYLEYIN